LYSHLKQKGKSFKKKNLKTVCGDVRRTEVQWEKRDHWGWGIKINVGYVAFLGKVHRTVRERENGILVIGKNVEKGGEDSKLKRQEGSDFKKTG